MKQKPILERVGDFMEGRGFYIVLFLCVAAIGISGYYLFSTLNLGGGETAVSAPTQVVVTPSYSLEAVKPTVSPKPAETAGSGETPTPAPAATPEDTTAEPQLSRPAQTEPAPAETASVFAWPVNGEILADYSLEVLAYDETMGDWRVHTGVDISSPVGTQVTALTGGTVTAVEQDDLMGTTVTISHGEGLESIYSNLALEPTVETGDTVRVGQVIGSVGTTAAAESARLPHLHLEMRLNGESVDPMLYLPEHS